VDVVDHELRRVARLGRLLGREQPLLGRRRVEEAFQSGWSPQSHPCTQRKPYFICVQDDVRYRTNIKPSFSLAPILGVDIPLAGAWLPRFFDSAALERGDESLTMLDKCQKWKCSALEERRVIM